MDFGGDFFRISTGFLRDVSQKSVRTFPSPQGLPDLGIPTLFSLLSSQNPRKLWHFGVPTASPSFRQIPPGSEIPDTLEAVGRLQTGARVQISSSPPKNRTQNDLGAVFHVISFYNILPSWPPSNICAEKETPHNL